VSASINTTCSNAFLKCSDPGKLQELADSLTAQDLLDDGLKLSLVLLGDLATEDHGDLVGLAELIQCGSPMKDERSNCHNIRLDPIVGDVIGRGLGAQAQV
jgi:hypothetical protein